MEITRYFPVRKFGAKTSSSSLRKQASLNLTAQSIQPGQLLSSNMDMDFDSNFGDENHDAHPSCSYKLDHHDENADSCDSGISMGSNFSTSSTEGLPTNFASLKVQQSIEIEGFGFLKNLSDEEAETEKKLQKKIGKNGSGSAKRPSFGLSDITNRFKESPKARTSFSSFDVQVTAICRKRSAVNLCDNFKKRKKSDSFSTSNEAENIPSKVETKFIKPILRRSQSCIEASHLDIPVSPEFQQSAQKGSAFYKIDGSTLLQWMEMADFHDRYQLIDCRYPYEYQGGHIRGAVNCYDPEKVQATFYPSDEEEFEKISSKIPIFYCEYSQTRGPNMATRLRGYDRIRNMDRYPALNYEEIYVLRNGYREFYSKEQHRDFCEPRGYVKMRHSNHVDELKRYTFHRSKSFAGTSVFRQTIRPKFGSFNKPERRRIPTLSVFQEKHEELISISDGINSQIVEETIHLAQLRVASPSPRSVARPSARRTIFPSPIAEDSFASTPVSSRVEAPKVEGPVSPSNVIDFDSDTSLVADEDTSPVPFGKSLIPLPVPKFT